MEIISVSFKEAKEYSNGGGSGIGGYHNVQFLYEHEGDYYYYKDESGLDYKLISIISTANKNNIWMVHEYIMAYYHFSAIKVIPEIESSHTFLSNFDNIPVNIKRKFTIGGIVG
jgi:hypothetical protein